MKIKYKGLIFLLILFTGCTNGQKKSKTQSYSKIKEGLHCDVTVTVNGEETQENKFVFGEKVSINFDNIIYYTKDDANFISPGISMLILKNEKDTISYQPDIILKDNGKHLPMSKQRISFKTFMPNGDNKKYKAIIKIWDTEGSGEFI